MHPMALKFLLLEMHPTETNAQSSETHTHTDAALSSRPQFQV